MPYIVEVDQSIKIEQSGPTVLAFSNGIAWAILIPSDVKRAAMRAVANRGKPTYEAYLYVFAAGVYLLLRDYLPQIRRITIDIEYEGKEGKIRSVLLEFIRKQMPDFESDTIIFAHVGKSSPADAKARAVRTGGDRRFKRVTLEELLEVLVPK